jgi:hypothetical protein
MWPGDDILAKTASMLVIAATPAALALLVEPRGVRGATSRA